MLIIMKITINDEEFYRTGGIFRQYCANPTSEQSTHFAEDPKIDLVFFEANRVHLPELYKFAYDTDEEMIDS
jgi:hypothetical protein